MATHSGPAGADDAIQGGARPMHTRRLATILALLGLLLGGPLVAAPRPAAAQEGACFQETGFCIGGPFLDYWAAHGGLAAFGYPLAAAAEEKLEDRRVHAVQYFERARLEAHPEHAGTPYAIQLGRLGRYHREPATPVPPIPDAPWFSETRQAVAAPFRDYWAAHDGLVTLGYPLTDLLPPGPDAGTPVQWFERGRLEWHPENAPPFDVLPSRVGAWLVAAREDRGAPGTRPARAATPPTSRPSPPRTPIVSSRTGGPPIPIRGAPPARAGRRARARPRRSRRPGSSPGSPS